MRDPKKIVVFTGAGISASAGLRTYRGPDGLWNDSEIVVAAQVETLQRSPRLSWDHWGGMRAQSLKSKPTAAHLALADAEARLPEGYSLDILTQNVDGLHGRAGSKSVIEFHGNVMKTRCTNDKCSFQAYEDHLQHDRELPHCPVCDRILRPDVVLFGDIVPSENITTARSWLKTCGTLIVVGTTLEVDPARSIVDIKKRFYSGVNTIWVNIEPIAKNPHAFREKYTASADDKLPQLLERLIPRAG